MSGSAFLQSKEFYTRNINPIGHYIQQMAVGLSLKNGISVEQAKAFIVNKIKNKEFPGMKDPVVEFFGRDHNLDRTKEEMPLSHFLQDVIKNSQVLVPTFTAYCSTKEDQSPLSTFIGANVKIRSIAKKASQQAKAEGKLELAFSKNIEQANKKENNNSLSGSFATESSVFENDTGHNTLTSITRSMASIGNALNERMLGGNRHYRNKNIAFSNILAIISSMDEEAVVKAMTMFGLHYPTPEDFMEVLRHSMRFYVFDKVVYKDLHDFAKKMSPVQRAAVVYNQDLYHLRKFNEGFVRKMLEDFSRIDRTQVLEDPIKDVRSRDGATVNYGHQVVIFEVQGFGHDYHKMPVETQHAVANVCANIDNQVQNYKTLISAFFLTKTVPNSTAFIQDMVRQDVVLSDTDSTMFSIDEWVNWYFGDLRFSQEAYAIAGAVMFMSTQCIAHCLAILSCNMGVADEHLFTLSMKPEYVFPVFVQSPVAKHYFTAKLVEEGKVFKDIVMEIKGVHNKNSALPPTIIGPAQELMEQIIRDIMAGKKISNNANIKEVADLERKIIASLRSSSVEFLKRSNIKEASAYGRNALESNFAHHTLWQEVFAPTYGSIDPPPYDVIKVPTTLTSPSIYKAWLDGMKNQKLAERMRGWSERHNKKQMPTFYFHLDKILSSAIPEEVIEVIDYRKIVLDLTNVRRMLLDSLGFPVRSEFLLTELGY